MLFYSRYLKFLDAYILKLIYILLSLVYSYMQYVNRKCFDVIK